MGCASPFSRILNSSFLRLSIGWLLRSITRTCSVTNSVSIFKVEFSSISALVGSGGFCFKTGAGGGGPSCGAMRRPGNVCAGVGVGCEVWGDGDGATVAAPVVRGRESTGCCALLAPAIMNENTALRLMKSTSVLRCARKNGKMRSLITAKPSVKKRLMSNYFRCRRGAVTARMNFKERSPRRMLVMPGRSTRVAASPINLILILDLRPLVFGSQSDSSLCQRPKTQDQRPSSLRIRDREITFFTTDEQTRQA